MKKIVPDQSTNVVPLQTSRFLRRSPPAHVPTVHRQTVGLFWAKKQWFGYSTSSFLICLNFKLKCKSIIEKGTYQTGANSALIETERRHERIPNSVRPVKNVVRTQIASGRLRLAGQESVRANRTAFVVQLNWLFAGRRRTLL